MLGRLPRAIGAALAASVLASHAYAAEDIRIVSGHPGTPWHAFAAVLAQQIQASLPGAGATLVRRGNGYWNPIVVNARRADFGLANTASAAWAYTGAETAYGKKKYTDIRAVMAGLRRVWIAAMLRESYIQASGHAALRAALGARRGAPRVVMRPAASVVPVAVDMLLAAMGSGRQILRERGGDVLQLGAAQIPSMIRGGRADLYFEAVGLHEAAALSAALLGDARLVDLPPNALATLGRASLTPLALPPRSEDDSRPVRTVELGTMLIVHRDVGNEEVYRMLEILIGAREALAGSHPAWRDYAPSPHVALKTRGVPLHRAALRFYRERRWPEMERRGPIPLPRPERK